jgi:hypothetical protein
MKLNNTIKYIATPSKIIMYLLLLVAGITILQFIIPGIVSISFPIEDEYPPRLPQPERTEAEKRLERIDNARKEFLPDGTIHLLSWSRKESDGTYWEEIQVQDINENLLWSGKEKDLPYEYLSWPNYQFIGRNAEGVTRRVITPVFSRVLVVPVILSEGQITQYWRYEPGKHYFIGVDAKGRKIGYAGSNGIQQFRSQVMPFEEVEGIDAWCPKDAYSPVLIWQTKNQLYEIDFQAHTVKLIFNAQNKEIAGVLMFNWLQIDEWNYRGKNIDTKEYRPVMRIDIKSGEHYLWLRDPNEKLVFRTPKDRNPRGISIAATDDKIFLKCGGTDKSPPPRDPLLWEQWEEEYLNEPFQKWIELYQIESNGNLKFLNRFEWTYPQRHRVESRGDYQEDLFSKARYYVKTVSSPLLDLALLWSYKRMTYSGKCGELSDFIATLIDEDDYYLMTNRPINLALSLLMVCFTFWHGWPRRTSWGKLFVWLVVVGVFNLAGLLAYLALNHTAVIKCPVCGRSRGLERVDCVRCGAELPVPERRKLDLIFNT